MLLMATQKNRFQHIQHYKIIRNHDLVKCSWMDKEQILWELEFGAHNFRMARMLDVVEIVSRKYCNWEVSATKSFRFWNALHDSRLHSKCRIHSIGANCLLFYWTDHANGMWMDLSEMRYRFDAYCIAYVKKIKSKSHRVFPCAKGSYFRFQFARLLCLLPPGTNSKTWVEPLMSARTRDASKWKKKKTFFSLNFPYHRSENSIL